MTAIYIGLAAFVYAAVIAATLRLFQFTDKDDCE